MSADNGIYILKTSGFHGHGHEYRVAHLQAVENVDWDSAHTGFTSEPAIRIKNAREMWRGCKVLKSEKKALEAAAVMLRSYPVVEYGISFIEIPLKF